MIINCWDISQVTYLQVVSILKVMVINNVPRFISPGLLKVCIYSKYIKVYYVVFIPCVTLFEETSKQTSTQTGTTWDDPNNETLHETTSMAVLL